MFGSKRRIAEEERLARLEEAENKLQAISVELQGVSERAQIRVDTLGDIVERLTTLKKELSRDKSSESSELVSNRC